MVKFLGLETFLSYSSLPCILLSHMKNKHYLKVLHTCCYESNQDLFVIATVSGALAFCNESKVGFLIHEDARPTQGFATNLFLPFSLFLPFYLFFFFRGFLTFSTIQGSNLVLEHTIRQKTAIRRDLMQWNQKIYQFLYVIYFQPTYV